MKKPQSRGQIRRDAKAAKKHATRRAIEQQYSLPNGALNPPRPVVKDGTFSYRPPGYFKRGGLKGVTYSSHIGRNYL